MKLNLYHVEPKYCEYLRGYEAKISVKDKRPWIGVVLNVTGFDYFAPLTSPKEKHKNINSSIDFLKIKGGKLGAINFNNMIPVNDKHITPINITKVEQEQYLNLLKEQLDWCNRNTTKIEWHAERIHHQIINKMASKSLLKRCCDFKLLEEKSVEYDMYKISLSTVSEWNDNSKNYDVSSVDARYLFSSPIDAKVKFDTMSERIELFEMVEMSFNGEILEIFFHEPSLENDINVTQDNSVDLD